MQSLRDLQVSAFMEQNELLQVIQPDIWSLREIRSFCVLEAKWIVLSNSIRHLRFERHYKLLCSWSKMNCCKWFNQAYWGLRELPCFCVLGARWIVASDSTRHMRFERTPMLLCSWSKMNSCKWFNQASEV
jgi:hypothetical protein